MHKENKLDSIVFEKKESILDEIQQARKLAVEFAESVKQQKLQKITEAKYKERDAFHKSREKFKSDLLGEFLQLAENTRGELFEYTEQKSEEAYNFIIESINDLSDKLSQSLEYGIQEQSAQFVTLFENRIAKLAQNILANKLLKEIESNNKLNNESIDVKFDTIFKSLTEILNEQVESTLSKYDKTILTLEQSNVELNDNIIKSSNKALSRIGTVKTQLEKSINDAELKIVDFYNNRIALIEQTVTDISVENKKHFIKLIEEGKQSTLNGVSQIKTDIPLIVAEKTRDANGDIDVKSIKTDLEKTISNRFTQELANVRRLIEMSSGGGSVAVQFANGGTMTGNLNVVGDISTTGVIYNNNFNSNNWNNTYTSVSNTSANWDNVYTSVSNTSANWNNAYTSVSNTSANWDNVYTSVSTTSANWNDTYTSVQANSGNWNTGYNTAIALNLSSGLWNGTYTAVSAASGNWNSAYNISTDYQAASSTFATYTYTNNTFFPLSGGTILGDTKVKFGDLTVYGNISATGSINYSNTFISTTSSLCALANSSYPIPGLYVSQAGTGDIATFYDVSTNREVFHVGGSEGYPGVGVNTSFPNKAFTVVGDISATGIIYNNNFDSTNWNGTYTTVQTNSATNWNYQGSDLKALSADWVGGNSAYTTVNASSANWDSAYTIVQATSSASIGDASTIIGLAIFI
jgi:hypothetical protein